MPDKKDIKYFPVPPAAESSSSSAQHQQQQQYPTDSHYQEHYCPSVAAHSQPPRTRSPVITVNGAQYHQILYSPLPDGTIYQHRPPNMGYISALAVILITILCPPIGVWAIAGCGFDLFVSICLTILGYIPGHIHAFYLIWIYYERKEAALAGVPHRGDAPGVYSRRVNEGGVRGYGTLPTHEPRVHAHQQPHQHQHQQQHQHQGPPPSYSG